MKLTCQFCGRSFRAPDNGYQWRRQYCSIACQKQRDLQKKNARNRNRYDAAMPALPGMTRGTP